MLKTVIDFQISSFRLYCEHIVVFSLFYNALFMVVSFDLNILNMILNILILICKQIYLLYVSLFHDTLLCKYKLDTWFTSKHGLQFQMKCITKTESVFICGGLMARFHCQNFLDPIFFLISSLDVSNIWNSGITQNINVDTNIIEW